MNDRARRIAAAILLGLAVSTSVAACVPGGSGRSDGEVAAELESKVLDAVPLAHGAYLGFSSAGSPNTHSALVRIYTGHLDSAQLADAADATLKVVWRGMPTEPASLSFQAAEGTKPAKPKSSDLSGVGLGDLPALLGAGRVGALGDMLDLSAEELTARYGAWTKPAGESGE